MYECKRIAVIQRGKSGNCFPAEICVGESARRCEARVFPPRAPPFWPPLKSEWRVWGRRLNMEKVLVVQKIGR